MNVKIRKGNADDLSAILALIQELADFEKAPQEVEVTVDEMKKWGFGQDAIFEFFVAEYDGKLCGMALYYYKYSTWKGKCLFLEDLIVTEPLRGKGIGKLLFQQVMNVAKEAKVRRMEWQVLDWNENAIAFYKKYDAHLDPEWLNGKFSFEQLQSFA